MTDESNFRSFNSGKIRTSDYSNSLFRISPDSEKEQEYFKSDFTESDPSYTLNKRPVLEHKSTEKSYYQREKEPIDPRKTVTRVNFCASCAVYIRKIEEIKRKQFLASEKFADSERHLIQYDKLLQIKDNRLTQQENCLKADILAFETEKEKFFQEKKTFQDEKFSLLREKEILALENKKIDIKLEEVENRFAELKILVAEYEIKNEEIKQREESQLILETQYKERLIVSREEDIQRLLSEEKFYKTSAEETQKTVFTEESYQKKKLKLKNKKNELGLWAKELKELSEKFENEHKQKILDFQAKSRILNENEQKLLNEKNKIAETQERVNEEIESIEELKSILKTQQENLEKERKFLQSSYNERLLYLEELKKITEESRKNNCFQEETKKFTNQEIPTENNTQKAETEAIIKEYEAQNNVLKNDLEFLKNKLKIVECSREEVESDNYELNIKVSSLSSKKKNLKARIGELEKIIKIDETDLRKELENLCAKNSNLEKKIKELEKEISSLNQQNSILLLKNEETMKDAEKYKGLYQSLKTENNRNNPKQDDGMSNQIVRLSEELEKKLEKVKEKEKELEKMQEFLMNEKKSIETAAEYVKTINDEINLQKNLLKEEKESVERQKIQLFEIDSKQVEKGKLLISKENELLVFKEKLYERERLISLKEKNISTPELVGIDKSIFDSRGSSPTSY